MKKIILPVLAMLICFILAGCGFSGSAIQLSSKGAPETIEKTFAVDGGSLSLRGKVSVIGSAELKILAPEGAELYAETFEDVRNQEVAIDLSGLAEGKDYTLILNAENAVSYDLSLSSEQKLLDSAIAAKPDKQSKSPAESK